MKTREFVFIGFLPVNKSEKLQKLENIKMYEQTIILYSNGEIDKKEPVQKNSDYSLIVKNGRIN